MTVTVTPGANPGPYNNTATADGTSPAGSDVTDVSQDGTNVDPDGDGDPGNNSVPTPVTFYRDAGNRYGQDVSAGPTNNGDGTFTLTYTMTRREHRRRAR